MIGWIASWIVFSASAGVIWEFALHDPPSLRGVVARGTLALFGVLLLLVGSLLVNFWGALAHHAWSEYDWTGARKLLTLHGVGFVVTAVPYVWFANRMLRRAWPHVLSWFADPQWSEAITTTISSTPLAVGVMLAVAAALFGLVVWRAGRQAFYAYRHALDTLGWRKLLLGIALMSYLRLLVPRRDFFLQAPIFSWMPFLAAAVVAHELIPVRVFAVAIPVLIVAFQLPLWANSMAPPLWIFLGTSEADSFRTFWSLRQTWMRHGLTLLDRTSPGGRQFYDAWRAQINAPPGLFYDPSAGRVWSLRTREGVWTIAVRLLAAFAPVIVVDWRNPSQIVESEVKWLARHGFASKAYFVAAAGTLITIAAIPTDGTLVDEPRLRASKFGPPPRAAVRRDRQSI